MRSRVASVSSVAPSSVTLSQRAGGVPPAVTAGSQGAAININATRGALPPSTPRRGQSLAPDPALSSPMPDGRPVQGRAQAGGDALGGADAPEMHVEEARLLPQGVVVQRRHLDAVLEQGA